MEDYHESLQRMLQAQLKVKINEAKKKEEVPESDHATIQEEGIKLVDKAEDAM